MTGHVADGLKPCSIHRLRFSKSNPKQMKIFVLLFIVALLALSPLGCAFIPMLGDPTPEQAALHIDPPKNGEQRFSVLKPAPDGVLVVYENFANVPGDPNQVQAGYAFVTQERFGWAVHEGGGVGGRPQHGILAFVNRRDNPGQHTILMGKTVDQRVDHIAALFSTGQVIEDTVANGLFGIVVEPKASLCQLVLLDTQRQRIELFGLKGEAQDLTELLHGDIDRARDECP